MCVKVLMDHRERLVRIQFPFARVDAFRPLFRQPPDTLLRFGIKDVRVSADPLERGVRKGINATVFPI